MMKRLLAVLVGAMVLSGTAFATETTFQSDVRSNRPLVVAFSPLTDEVVTITVTYQPKNTNYILIVSDSDGFWVCVENDDGRHQTASGQMTCQASLVPGTAYTATFELAAGRTDVTMVFDGDVVFG